MSLVDEMRVWRKYKISILVSIMSLFDSNRIIYLYLAKFLGTLVLNAHIRTLFGLF